MTETTACSRELGYELRHRRELVGLTAQELADRMGWAQSKISRLETGVRGATETDVVQYLAHLGYPVQEMQPLRALCRHAGRHLGYWLTNAHTQNFHETRATHITSYHPDEIPRPLRTGDDPPQPATPTRRYLIGEGAIRRAATLEQVLKLLLLADLPHLTIQAVPDTEPYGGAFQVMEFRLYPPLVHVHAHAARLTLEEESYTLPYLALANRITHQATGPEGTRALLVELADYQQLTA
ncbi:Scr1 family TA system antitoxin-like transcriptional regulator [Kibdelosporangium lantanae]|uniref:Scr1 family TA system antitoxin-like transcriptional regulator n=1 Tax=Kibdelosporangium lantanae TaxID=1497396 RepID=A0ABW3MDQ2_9PSEU